METFEEYNAALVEVSQLQAVFLGAENFQKFLDRLAILTAEETCHHCGIIIRSSASGSYTLASSDTVSREIDAHQIAHGEGPAIEAIRDGVVVAISDLRSEGRWNGFGAHASTVGAHSCLSYPIHRGRRTFGALNLYSVDRVALADHARAEAAGIAAREARAIELSTQMVAQAELIGNLQVALSSRSTIDKAVGVLMAEQRCDSRTAFELLRSASQHRNVKLRDVAEGIVSRFQGPQAES